VREGAHRAGDDDVQKKRSMFDKDRRCSNMRMKASWTVSSASSLLRSTELAMRNKRVEYSSTIAARSSAGGASSISDDAKLQPSVNAILAFYGDRRAARVFARKKCI
jgi:hypothetical protein